MATQAQSTLPQPSRECTVRNSFTERETGYIRKEQLLAFLQAMFGSTKEYCVQVNARNPAVKVSKRCDSSYFLTDYERAMVLLCPEKGRLCKYIFYLQKEVLPVSVRSHEALMFVVQDELEYVARTLPFLPLV